MQQKSTFKPVIMSDIILLPRNLGLVSWLDPRPAEGRSLTKTQIRHGLARGQAGIGFPLGAGLTHQVADCFLPISQQMLESHSGVRI